jgi:hypothetical protein
MSNVNPTKSGNGVWSQQAAERGHILRQHGVALEVADVRADVGAALNKDAGMTFDEWDAPAAASVLLLGSVPVPVTGAAYHPVLMEFMDGAPISPPTGTLAATSGVWHYTPAAAPNGTHKYAIVYMAGRPGTVGVGSPKQ